MTLVRFSLKAVRSIALASAVTVCLAPVAGLQSMAQTQRGPVQRIVTGKVVNKGDQPIKGAIVYLKDDRALTVTSYISEDDGTYRFGQLSPNTDYTLYAEISGQKSKPKSISSFDSRNVFTIQLKIDKFDGTR